MNQAGALADHAALVAALRAAAAYPHPVGTIEVIETHISSVLLAGEHAYKLKKPVNFGFVDFSTLERRRRFCEEELRLNRRGAPQLYLDVVPITGSRRDPRIGPAGAEGFEYAVHMRRFDDEARLDRVARAGGLTRGHVDRLAANIAAYHAQSAPAPGGSVYGAPDLVWRWADENLGSLERARLGPADAARIRELRDWTRTEFERRAGLFEQRRAAGHVRECHGDLHLGNLVLLDGAPLPFDCIEFNDELRYIDVVNDVAFAFMDLIDHDLAPLAWRFLGGYCERSGDYEGLATLRFYAVYRALVRAKIALLRGRQEGTPPDEQAADTEALNRYVEVARGLSFPPKPQLVLMSGVTASGKSTVAALLAEQLGAVRLRSDLERKRLFRIAPADHAGAGSGPGGGIYTAGATQRTYARLALLAGTLLDAGITPIVDATFLRRDQRQAFRDLARDRGVPAVIVACAAGPGALQARVAERLARGGDPSDATQEVLDRQLALREPLSVDEQSCAMQVDTGTAPAELEARCRQVALALAGAGGGGGLAMR
jgi:hypothetical protein